MVACCCALYFGPVTHIRSIINTVVGFNIRKEENIHESIVVRFPERSDNAIVINYCILYAKQYIYLKKKMTKKINKFQCRLLMLPVPLKNTLKIEKSICIKNKSSSPILISYMKMCKSMFHNVLYCIIICKIHVYALHLYITKVLFWLDISLLV